MSGTHVVHHELQILLGGYVLGGLSAADRRLLEEHLPDCAECTAELARFAVVPGLLQLAAVSGVKPDPPTPPAESVPRLLTAAKARRRRRRQRMVLAAAATVVMLAAAALGGWLFTRPAPPPPSTPFVAIQVPESAAPSGQLVMESKTWGTQLRLTMYYGNSTSSLSAWAVATDGHQEQAASWMAPPDGRCYVIGATSIKRDQLDRVDIRTSDGQTVLRANG